MTTYECNCGARFQIDANCPGQRVSCPICGQCLQRWSSAACLPVAVPIPAAIPVATAVCAETGQCCLPFAFPVTSVAVLAAPSPPAPSGNSVLDQVVPLFKAGAEILTQLNKLCSGAAPQQVYPNMVDYTGMLAALGNNGANIANMLGGDALGFGGGWW